MSHARKELTTTTTTTIFFFSVRRMYIDARICSLRSYVASIRLAIGSRVQSIMIINGARAFISYVYIFIFDEK